MVHVHEDKWDVNQQFCISNIGLCACRMGILRLWKTQRCQKKVHKRVWIIREQKREHLFWCFLPLHKFMAPQHLESWAQSGPSVWKRAKWEWKMSRGKQQKSSKVWNSSQMRSNQTDWDLSGWETENWNREAQEMEWDTKTGGRKWVTVVYWNARIWDHKVKSVIGRFRTGLRRLFPHTPELSWGSSPCRNLQRGNFRWVQKAAGQVHRRIIHWRPLNSTKSWASGSGRAQAACSRLLGQGSEEVSLDVLPLTHCRGRHSSWIFAPI